MSEALKPCPFCGGEALEFTGEDAAPYRWTVECALCGAHVGDRDTRHRAREKWNRRAERTCRMELRRIGGFDELDEFCEEAVVCSACREEMPFDEDAADFMFSVPDAGHEWNGARNDYVLHSRPPVPSRRERGEQGDVGAAGVPPRAHVPLRVAR